jgi:hypothetical protein
VLDILLSLVYFLHLEKVGGCLVDFEHLASSDSREEGWQVGALCPVWGRSQGRLPEEMTLVLRPVDAET